MAAIFASAAQAEIDGHGPDAWRVTDVAANDVLNARMGPGTSYPVIETFAHDERNIQQITCVPFYTAAHYTAMTEQQLKALPSRWCLMRNEQMTKAGWVAQRYITPEGQDDAANAAMSGGDPVAQAQDLVRELYDRQFQAERANQRGIFDPDIARNYFTDDITAWLASANVGAHPLYGAQDFNGAIGEPVPDPEQPMLRGMITINVDFTNFGKPQRATYYLRADTTKPGSPLRIFRVEHDGWSYP